MNIKKSCAACLALLTVCSFGCSEVFASSKSFDDATMFSYQKIRRHNTIAVPENECRYKEVKSAFKTLKRKKCEIEEPEMKKIIINRGVQSIGSEAFYGRNDIDEVIIPESVKDIKDYAFANCTNLNKIVIKGDVFIGEHSFKCCENLIEISIKGRIRGICSTSFLGCENLGIIRLGRFHSPNDGVIKAIRSFNAYSDESGDRIFDNIVIY